MPQEDQVMHGEVSFGEGQQLYVSDAFEGNSATMGDNMIVHLEVDSEAEVKRYFEALAAGGRVTMPVEKQFWGAVYGSFLVDEPVHGL
jgi:PhnB protein